MAFPWNVRLEQRRAAWLLYTFLFVLYVSYCIIVTVEAFNGRDDPPVSIKYDKNMGVQLPDIILSLDPLAVIGSEVLCWPNAGPNLDTTYLFHSDPNLEQSWNGTTWNLGKDERPLFVGNTSEQIPITYGHGPPFGPGTRHSYCLVEYKQVPSGRFEISFLLSQITYIGDFNEPYLLNVVHCQESTQTNDFQGFLTGTGSNAQPFIITIGSSNDVHLTPILNRELGRSPYLHFKTVSTFRNPNAKGDYCTWISLGLDSQGTQIVTEHDTVSVTSLLAKYGGIWFFVPLIFSFAFVAIKEDIRLTAISGDWFKSKVLTFCCSSSKVIERRSALASSDEL